MEMLSEEAIANLMLEDELNEATHSIFSPHVSDEFLAPPGPKGAWAPSQMPLSGTAAAAAAATGDEAEKALGAKKEIKDASQASSSDSGEPWEVVSNPQELNATEASAVARSDLDTRAEEGEAFMPSDLKKVAPATIDSKPTQDALSVSMATRDNIPVAQVRISLSHSKELVCSTPISLLDRNQPGSSQDVTRAAEEENLRPRSLAVSSFYPKSSSSVSCSSSSSSNSISEEFSPTYAPLSDTPETESKTGSSLVETTPSSAGNSVQPTD